MAEYGLPEPVSRPPDVAAVEGERPLLDPLVLAAALRSVLLQMVTSFLPPLKTPHLDRARRTIRRCASTPESVAALLRSIIPDLQAEVGRGSRFTALEAVLVALCDRLNADWQATLATVAREWPGWGTPWVIAAKHENDPRRLRHLLMTAHRLVAIGDPYLISRLDKLRRHLEGGAKDQADLRELVAELIVRHRPTIRNLSRFANQLKQSTPSRLGTVIDLVLHIHGTDPYSWKVLPQYDELSAAGALCQLVNMDAARKQLPDHAFAFWNQAAIHFLERSLTAAGRGGTQSDDNRAFARVRLAETYASAVKFSPLNTPPEEYLELLERAREHARVTGRIDPRLAYQALRHLAILLSSRAWRAQHQGWPRAEVDEVVSAASQAYRDLRLYATPEKSRQVLQWHIDFLQGMGRYQESLELASETESADFIAAVALHHDGKAKEAIKRLVVLTSDPNDESVLGYANLLTHYLQGYAGDAKRLPDRLLQSARSALSRLVPKLLNACDTAIARGKLVQARRHLACIAESGAGGHEAEISILRARIGSSAVRRGEAVAGEVAAEIWTGVQKSRELLDDDRLRDALLEILVDAPTSLPISEEEIASLVDSGEADAKALTWALRWQLETGNLAHWPARLAQAWERFPKNQYLRDLPAQVWRVREAEALWLVRDLAALCEPRQASLGLLAEALERMPLGFFAAPDAVRLLQDLVGRLPSRDAAGRLATVLAEGLVRNQLAQWPNGSALHDLVQENARRLACLPDSVRVKGLAQWLGALRVEFEQVVVEGVKLNLDSLVERLHQPDNLYQQTWRREISRFLNTLKAPPRAPETGPDAVEEVIVRYCEMAAETFNPIRPDSAYWRELTRLVGSLVRAVPDGDLAARLAQAWTEVHRRIALIIQRRISDIAWPALHAFKNLLAKDPGREVSPRHAEQFTRILSQTRRFLLWHRWPSLRKLDLGQALERAAYRPPFAASERPGTILVLTYAVRPASPVLILADQELLAEALYALLENALKCRPQNLPGWIWAEVSRQGAWGAIEIVDDGSGASADLLCRLNEVSGKAFSSRGSTGYGTRLCHRIVALHLGQLEFQSAGEGMGMRVRIRLPLVNEEVAE